MASETTVVRSDATVSAVRLRRRHGWLVIAVALAVTAGVAVAGAVHWRSKHSAHDLYGFGGRITQSRSAAPVSAAVYVNASIAPADLDAANADVNVHTVTPHITTNSAGVKVEVLTCKVAPRSLMPTMDADTSNCLSTARFSSGRLRLGNPGTQIIYKLTAAHVGEVRIEGTDITYSDAHRSGRQRVGIGTRIRFIGPGR